MLVCYCKPLFSLLSPFGNGINNIIRLLTKIAQKPKVVCYCYRKPIGNGINNIIRLLTKIAQKPKVVTTLYDFPHWGKVPKGKIQPKVGYKMAKRKFYSLNIYQR
jgi:hypothetical protein